MELTVTDMCIHLVKAALFGPVSAKGTDARHNVAEISLHAIRAWIAEMQAWTCLKVVVLHGFSAENKVWRRSLCNLTVECSSRI